MEEKEHKIEVVDITDNHEAHEHKHHESHEHKHHEHKHPFKVQISESKSNPWMIATGILAVLLLIVGILWLTAKPGQPATPTPTAAAAKDNLIFMYSDGCTTECDKIEPAIKELAAQNNMDFSRAKYFQSMPVPGFVLVHNNTVYLGPISDENSFVISMCSATGNANLCKEAETAQAEIEKQALAEQQKAMEGLPKADKPKVELFVMSFCPYGVQAEGVMQPVVDLLGDKADIEVRFIASVGDTLDTVQSLHGVVEGKEDARQLCVADNYDQDTLWEYITAINKDCYPVYRQGDAVYDACWKKAAAAADIDIDTIEKCMDDDAVDLLKEESAAAGTYGVSGSPTLIINGQRYSGQRTSEAFKQAICNGFTSPPEECEEALSTAGTTAAGDC